MKTARNYLNERFREASLIRRTLKYNAQTFMPLLHATDNLRFQIASTMMYFEVQLMTEYVNTTSGGSK